MVWSEITKYVYYLLFTTIITFTRTDVLVLEYFHFIIHSFKIM